MITNPSFRGNGPKRNGYAHTSTSPKSPKADRKRRLAEREAMNGRLMVLPHRWLPRSSLETVDAQRCTD